MRNLALFLAITPALVLAGPGPQATVRVFLYHECPCNVLCAPELNELADELAANHIRLVGVTDLSAKETTNFADKLGFRFPLVADPDRRLIRSSHAMYSLELGIFDAKGKQLRHFGGYDQEVVRNLGNAMTAWLDRPIQLSPARFPTTRRIGCAFPVE